MNWTPLTIEELSIEISQGESNMDKNISDFWKKIKTIPEKWSESEYGKEGNGFWVVAKFKNLVVYYNDIEEGFNISEFRNIGEIQEYGAEQDELNIAILKLIELKNYLSLSL